MEDYEFKGLITINCTDVYTLIEFPANHVPRYAEKMLYELRLKGVIPIIAHPDILHKLVKQGALTQITAGSITGEFGKKIKKFSLELIEHHLRHVIASDAHNITTRSFYLQSAYETVEKAFGISTSYYFKENTYLLIKGM